MANAANNLRFGALGNAQSGSGAAAANSVGLPNGFTLRLPNNGLFQYQPSSGEGYLIETDPRFASYQNWISSDYFNERMSQQSLSTHKRLGDAFYEQKMVAEQIQNLTGKTYLAGANSQQGQFQTLMDNAISHSKDLQLEPGIALSAAQAASLTSDIVWMVNERVNGQDVLVPVVYLANVKDGAVKPTGALISAENVIINKGGAVSNSGTIVATEQVRISADSIVNQNGSINGGKSVNLVTVGDITNLGGSISGRQVTLNAGGNIKNETIVSSLNMGSAVTPLVGNIATISATGGLSMQANGNIDIIGAKVSAGEDLALQAKGKISVNSIETVTKNSAQYADGTRISYENTSHLASALSAGGSATIKATGDVTLTGADVKAGGDLAIKSSGGNVQIIAETDRATLDVRQTGRAITDVDLMLKGGNLPAMSLGSEQVANKHYQNQNSAISGGTLTSGGSMTIGAKQNVDLAGVHIDATKDLTVFSQDGNVTIGAVAAASGSIQENCKNQC